jgi:predicted aspartyl protease
MGYVRAKAMIGDPERTRIEEVDFLADSGAFFPTIPPSLAERLNLKPVTETELMLADKRQAKATLSNAYFSLLNRQGVFQVAIMDVVEPLLGVTVFEGLGIRINPTTGELEHSRPYGLAIL